MKTTALVSKQNGVFLFLLFLCTNVAAQDIHRIPFDSLQRVMDEVEMVALYTFSGNKVFYEKESYEVKFPENFSVKDTAFTFVFFQGREGQGIPQHTLILVGNYTQSPTVIVDLNHNLDFSDDRPLLWKDREATFQFELPHREYEGAKSVIQVGKARFNKPEAVERVNRIPAFTKNPAVPAAYWWDVSRMNYKTAAFFTGKDSVFISLIDGTGEGLFNDLNWDRVVVGDYRKGLSFKDVMERGYNLEENLKISIKNKTYNVKEVEPGGKYILLEGSDVKVNRLSEDSLIPNFAFTTTTGAREDLYSLSGGKKWVLLDFWGSWCKPCIANTPRLQAIHEQQKDLTIIGLIAHEKDTKNALSFIEKKKISWLNGFATEEMLKDLRVKDFPRYILLDESHKMVKFNASLTDVEALIGKK